LRRVKDALGGVASVQAFSATSGLGEGELEKLLEFWLQAEDDHNVAGG